MLYWEMTKIFNYHKIRYFITSDRRQSRRLWTIDERGSQIARIFHLSPVRQTNCNPKSLFLTVFDLRSSIASTFSIATYPVCVLIQWIRNQNNLKQELGVIYIFQSCFCWKKFVSTPDSEQSKTLLTIDERGSKLARNSVLIATIKTYDWVVICALRVNKCGFSALTDRAFMKCTQTCAAQATFKRLTNG